MMTKLDHIDYWIKTSEDDWITVESLFQSGRYIHCLYFAHLSTEKICKALWVKYNVENIPPKIHNLVKILSQTKVELEKEQLEYLLEVNRFQLQGRYPDYINNIQKICNLEYTEKNLKKIIEIRICLTKLLQ
jgi:HEPN domain-containing protein